MNTLKWLEEWFKVQCNDSWEHMSGIRISTSDNPGWIIKIELEDTELEGFEAKLEMFRNTEDDWYGYKVEDGEFQGFGDPTKLETLIKKFKEIVEKNI